MKAAFILMLNLLVLHSAFAQNEEKVKKLKFCGYKYKDSAMLRKHFAQQIAFLDIKDGDTIADIGSSSGTYIGCINVIAEFKKAHFILVDIDSNCLNSTKVNNMIAHYEGVRGRPFDNTISFVVNTVDSLWLPVNSKKKLWIFNTLHEIPDKAGMIKQISAVLQAGGEIIIAEVLATEKNRTHVGCHYPLMSDGELKKLMDAAGFEFRNIITNPIPVKKMRNPYCLYRFIKR